MTAQIAATSSQNEYLDILDEAWQQHLALRAENAPTVISTFAGCGGSSLGYSMAGVRELLAVEWDDNAVETFCLNFPDVPVYHDDIVKLSVEECLRLADIEPGELDILDGSPPCQGFSTAGKRNMSDDRNQLFREYVRLLRGLQPKVFVMENVSGMVKGKMKLIFAEVMRELKASGYQVSCRLLNAMYFNVPQSRQRLIFIGVQDDLEIEPSYPKANILVSNKGLLPLEFEGLRFLSFRHTKNTPDNLRKLGQHPTGITGGGIVFEGRQLLRDPHYVKRFQSFPKQFKFHGSSNQQLMQIGNSVPPLFMRSIARHIREQILNQPTETGR